MQGDEQHRDLARERRKELFIELLGTHARNESMAGEGIGKLRCRRGEQLDAGNANLRRQYLGDETVGSRFRLEELPRPVPAGKTKGPAVRGREYVVAPAGAKVSNGRGVDRGEGALDQRRGHLRRQRFGRHVLTHGVTSTSHSLGVTPRCPSSVVRRLPESYLVGAAATLEL